METYQELFKQKEIEIPDVGVTFKSNGEILSTKGIYADEGLSGTKLKNRKALLQLLEDAQKGLFEYVYVKNIARLARNIHDLTGIVQKLKDCGVHVYFEDIKQDTSDIKYEFTINLFGLLAHEESNSKSVAVRFGVRKAQKEGKWNSQVPFGYKLVNGKLELNSKEAEKVKSIQNLYLNDGWGTGKIARYLNSIGCKTKKGKQWSQSQVCSILDNCIYTGMQINHTIETNDLRLDKERYKAVPENEWIIKYRPELRIIDDDAFELIKLERKTRREINNKNIYQKDSIKDISITRTSSKLLFSNLLYCSSCGSNMKRKKRHAYKRKDGSMKELGYEWTCQRNDMYGKDKCKERNALTEEYLINEVKNKIIELQKNEYLVNKLYQEYLDLKYNTKDIETEIIKFNNEITRIKNLKKTLIELYSNKAMTIEEYKINNDEQSKELEKNETKLNKLLYVDKEIKKENIKFNNYISHLKELDINNLTDKDNGKLKTIIKKIFVTSLSKKDISLGIYKEYQERKIDIIWNFMGENSKEMHDKWFEEIYCRPSQDIDIIKLAQESNSDVVPLSIRL